jgi:ANTAR domain
MLKDRVQLDDSELDGASPALAHLERIVELEDEVTQLREALAVRQRYGVVTGVVAVRYGITPERAWQFLVRLSQHSNLKISVVTRVIHDRTFGRLAPEDEALAARIDAVICGQSKAMTSIPVPRKAHGDRR